MEDHVLGWEDSGYQRRCARSSKDDFGVTFGNSGRTVFAGLAGGEIGSAFATGSADVATDTSCSVGTKSLGESKTS